MFQYPGFSHRLALDFETYSEAPLSKCGVHVYAQHPSTEVLMLAWAIDDGEVQQWLPHVTPRMPLELGLALADPQFAKIAFNAAFERLIFKHVLGLDIPTEQWRCTMVASYYLGFVGGLDAILGQTALNLSKDPRGRRLIHKFSKPAPKNHIASRYNWGNAPEEFQEFCEYNVQDVVVERQLMHWLARYPMMHEWDWHRYIIDQQINDRGVYCDTSMAAGAVDMWKAERERLKEEMGRVTGLPKVTRGPVLEWLQSQGVTPATMAKDELTPLADADDTPPVVAQALRLWIAKEAKATSKYTAVLSGVCDDDRARGLFQFKGASRTDRTAGRRIQLQNLKRSVAGRPQQMDNLCAAIQTGSPLLLNQISGDSVSDALGYSIRHCFQAAPGESFIACDLTSIESVVLGWLTYCEGINSIFREGKDTYKPFAAQHFGVPYEAVTKAQRTFAKPSVLGCGYMLSWRGLLAYADAMGVTMGDEDAQSMVNTFRTMYHEVPAFWKWIDQAVKYVVTSGRPAEGYHLLLERDSDFLRIWLPSGRAISYYQPQVSRRVAPWSAVETPYDFGNDDPLTSIRAKFPQLSDVELAQKGFLKADKWLDNASYMGTLPNTQWGRVHVHPGHWTENIIQSIAYDILFHGIKRATDAGLPVVIQVHDEIVGEVPDGQAPASLATLQQCMTDKPAWASDMWLGAEGYISKRYKKD